MNSFRERLQFYIEQTGYSANGLARDAGMNSTFVRDIIVGNVKIPSLPGILGLCRALKVAPHHLCPELLGAYPENIQRILNKMPSDSPKRMPKPVKPFKFRSVEERCRIVEETFMPGATVAEVSRRLKLHRNQITLWRKQYRDGKLGRTAITAKLRSNRKQRLMAA